MVEIAHPLHVAYNKQDKNAPSEMTTALIYIYIYFGLARHDHFLLFNAVYVNAMINKLRSWLNI